MWRDRYQQMPRTELESNYRKLLTEDMADAETTAQKDTVGIYSLLEQDEKLREQVMLYSSEAQGEARVKADRAEPNGVSAFYPISKYDKMYRTVRDRFLFVPIHQQLVKSYFSKFDSCARAPNSSELDAVRTGQYRSAQSRHITADNPTPQEVRNAGKAAQDNARALKLKLFSQLP